MIYKISNKRLITDVFNYDVILFVIGINNSMNNGFPYELSVNFPEILRNENERPYGDKRKLGTIYKHKIHNTIFCSCCIHCGGYHKKENNEFIEYDKLETCLKEINQQFKNKKIATYYLGIEKFDGNSDENKIYDIIEKTLTNNEIYLYTDKQPDFRLEMFQKIAELRQKKLDKLITNDEYSKERSNIEWIRRYGLYKEKPDDYIYKPKQQYKKSIRFIGKKEK